MGSHNNAFLQMSMIRNEQTKQTTTFNLADKTKTVWVRKGESVVITEVEGSGFISQLWTTFTGWFWRYWDPGQPVDQTVLKALLIKIYWDGADEPAVCAPVGDFFGNGLCQMNSFCSNYVGMSSGGFYCKLPMPFKKGFKVEFENRHDQLDIEVFLNVLYQLTDLPKECGYLHAQFRTARNSGPEPIVIAEAAGRGHYAGCTISMQGQELNELAFLEAPEYIYVDEDGSSPTITGTGLEDYFLGGWYFREGPFAGPTHGVPVKDALRSSIAMYRFHDMDAIHFKESFKFCFVHPWESLRLKPFVYSSVSFLYLDSPEGQRPVPMNLDELVILYRIKDTDHQSIP